MSDTANGGHFLITIFGIMLLALVILVSIAGASPFAYITNSESNTVSVIDTLTNKVIKTVNVGPGPGGVAATPDGKKVYVTNFNSNTVSVIDTATNTVTATVNVGHKPSSCGQFIGPKITPPVSDFSASPLSGKAPLTVSFKNKSTGSPGNYIWAVSLGTSFIYDHAQTPPPLKLTKAGKYTVSLTVTNAADSNTKAIINYITVT